jgi:translation initiation factor 4E
MNSSQTEVENKKIPDEEYISLGVNSKEKTEADNERKTSLTLSGQHKLNSTWVFWYISRKEKVHEIPYEQRLKKIASFSTLEDFFRYYVFLKSASEVERNTDLSIFKEGYKPLWESCPEGSCWFFRFKKSDDPQEIDLRWEKLVFALIGNFT